MNVKKHRVLPDSTRRIIEMLLAVLPDNRHDDESWRWCWEELSDDAQEQVVEARHEAMQLLGRFHQSVEGELKCQ